MFNVLTRDFSKSIQPHLSLLLLHHAKIVLDFIYSWHRYVSCLPMWLACCLYNSWRLRHALCIHRCQVPSVKEFLPEGQAAEAVDTAFTVQTPVEEFKSSSPLQEEPESEELQDEEESRDSSEAEEEPEPITQQPQSISSTSVSQTDSLVIHVYSPSNFKLGLGLLVSPPALFLLHCFTFLTFHTSLLFSVYTKYIQLPQELDWIKYTARSYFFPWYNCRFLPLCYN